MSIVCKDLGLNRLTHPKSEQIIGEPKCGSRQNSGTADTIFAISADLSNHGNGKRARCYLCTTFADIIEAFDNINPAEAKLPSPVFEPSEAWPTQRGDVRVVKNLTQSTEEVQNHDGVKMLCSWASTMRLTRSSNASNVELVYTCICLRACVYNYTDMFVSYSDDNVLLNWSISQSTYQLQSLLNYP